MNIMEAVNPKPNQNVSKKKLAIKNPIFIKNMSFPKTEFEPEHEGKYVNTIRHIKISKKILEKRGKEQEINQVVWEYHSDRSKRSVDETLKKFKGNGELHVTFSGDPQSYKIDNIIRPKNLNNANIVVTELDTTKCVNSLDIDEKIK